MMNTTQRSARLGIRFGVAFAGGALAGFALWCGTDYVHVRFPRVDPFGALDWSLLVYPFLLLAASLLVLRRRPALALAATLLSCEAAVFLIVLFGIPFHFFMGGDS